MLAKLLPVILGLGLTDISNTVSKEHQSRSRDTLCISTDVRRRHLKCQYKGRHVTSHEIVAEQDADAVRLPIDLPHQSYSDDCRDQPTGHDDRAAVLELGGDESATQDPDDLECALRDT
jgi:hypothetical protein